jgi:uncharacterized membrane protein YbhN (UPF0104 family)
VIVSSAIPIAILTNVLRVSGTGVLARFYGSKVADGFFHSFSGWVMYVVAFLMLFAVGWSLDRFGRRSVAETSRRRQSEVVPARAVEGSIATESLLVKGID